MLILIVAAAVVTILILGCACLVPIGFFWWCIVAGVLCAMMAALGLCLTFVGHKNTEEDVIHLQNTVRTILGMAVGALLSLIIMGGTVIYCSNAKAMDGDWWHNHNFAETVQTAMRTPDTAASTEAGDIIIVYKFGCEDCDAIYDSAKEYIASQSANVKWIASNSEFGKQFCSDYSITWTPTGVYMLKTPIANTEIIQIQLGTNEDGSFDTSELHQLIEYQNADK